MVENSQKKNIGKHIGQINHCHGPRFPVLCFCFVSVLVFSLPPSLSLGSPGQEAGGSVWPGCSQSTIFKRLAVVTFQCRIVLFQSVTALERHLVFFFFFWAFFCVVEIISCVFFFQDLPNKASYLHLQPFVFVFFFLLVFLAIFLCLFCFSAITFLLTFQ